MITLTEGVTGSCSDARNQWTGNLAPGRKDICGL